MTSQYSKITLMLAVLSMLICLLSLSYIDYPVTTLLESLPIVFLILFSLRNHHARIKGYLLAALIFSLLGNIAFSLPISFSLQLTILFFILAQYAYILLFLTDGDFQHKRVFAFLALLSLLAISLYKLYPNMGEMKVPVIVYLCWLVPMVYCALHVKQRTSIVSLGAFLFLFSDLIFAVNQFVFAEDKLISILVMYLYYSAQFLLVLGTSEIKNTEEAPLQPSISVE